MCLDIECYHELFMYCVFMDIHSHWFCVYIQLQSLMSSVSTTIISPVMCLCSVASGNIITGTKETIQFGMP